MNYNDIQKFTYLLSGDKVSLKINAQGIKASIGAIAYVADCITTKYLLVGKIFKVDIKMKMGNHKQGIVASRHTKLREVLSSGCPMG